MDAKQSSEPGEIVSTPTSFIDIGTTKEIRQARTSAPFYCDEHDLDLPRHVVSNDRASTTKPERSNIGVDLYAKHTLTPGPDPDRATPQDRFRQFMMEKGKLPAEKPVDNPPSQPIGPPTGPASIATTPATTTKQADLPVRAAQRHGVFPIETLSRECQSRGFNPNWRQVEHGKGWVSWEIMLRNVHVRDDKIFEDPTQAKQAIARKGLGMVKSMARWALHEDPRPWPPAIKIRIPGTVQQGRKVDHGVLAKVSSTPQPKVDRNDPTGHKLAGDAGSGLVKDKDRVQSRTTSLKSIVNSNERSVHDNYRPADVYRPVEERKGIQSPIALNSRPSSSHAFEAMSTSTVDMNNPREARAFLRGVEVGKQMTEAQQCLSTMLALPRSGEFKTQRQRSRSRSPQRYRDEAFRSVRDTRDGLGRPREVYDERLRW